METTQVTSSEQVEPKTLQTETENNDFSSSLESVGEEVIKEIRRCDDQVSAWQNRKRELQAKMNETLQRIRQATGQEALPEPKKTRSKNKKTISQHILGYLEEHGPSRNSEIRKYLLSVGKKTSPGVALSRLVGSKDIVHVERGLYKKV